MMVTPEIVFIYHTACMGGNLEYLITPNISIGGDVLLFLEVKGA